MKIAVCDDDRTTRGQIASLIKEHNPDAEIITFESGEDMIKSQDSFEISFLDVEMNAITGIDVAKNMRAEQEKWENEVRRRASVPGRMSERREYIAPRTGIVDYDHEGYGKTSEYI